MGVAGLILLFMTCRCGISHTIIHYLWVWHVSYYYSLLVGVACLILLFITCGCGRTHMQDLKDVTNNVHYEKFRCFKLAGVVNSPDPKHFHPPSRYVTLAIHIRLSEVESHDVQA